MITNCLECLYALPIPLQKDARQCRRNPPIAVPIQQHGGLGSISMYPVVGKGDGCGDGERFEPSSVAVPQGASISEIPTPATGRSLEEVIAQARRLSEEAQKKIDPLGSSLIGSK